MGDRTDWSALRERRMWRSAAAFKNSEKQSGSFWKRRCKPMRTLRSRSLPLRDEAADLFRAVKAAPESQEGAEWGGLDAG